MSLWDVMYMHISAVFFSLFQVSSSWIFKKIFHPRRPQRTSHSVCSLLGKCNWAEREATAPNCVTNQPVIRGHLTGKTWQDDQAAFTVSRMDDLKCYTASKSADKFLFIIHLFSGWSCFDWWHRTSQALWTNCHTVWNNLTSPKHVMWQAEMEVTHNTGEKKCEGCGNSQHLWPSLEEYDKDQPHTVHWMCSILSHTYL